MSGIVKGGALWFVFLFAGFFLHHAGISVSDWGDLFAPIIASGQMQAEFLFPVLFVGRGCPNNR